jgi:hypothetical protein
VEISSYKIPSRVNKHKPDKGLQLSEAEGTEVLHSVKLWLKTANIFEFPIMIDSKKNFRMIGCNIKVADLAFLYSS